MPCKYTVVYIDSNRICMQVILQSVQYLDEDFTKM